MITDHTIAIWRMAARDDNWHRIFVASDIREMVGEIERLQKRIGELEMILTNHHLHGCSIRGYEQLEESK
jgi:hypothetical protein